MVQIENILVVFHYKTIFKWHFLEMRIEFHNKVGSRGATFCQNWKPATLDQV